MIAVNPYLKQYKKNQVETASPEKILILLYDGAIQFLNKAKTSLAEGDAGEFHHSLVKCEKIIIEFMNSLDMEKGGSLAENLYSLYQYYNRLLVEAGVSKNITKVDEVLLHLTNLRNTWLKAIEISNAEKQAKLMDEEPNESQVYSSQNDISDSEDKYEISDVDYDEDEDDEDDEDS